MLETEEAEDGCPQKEGYLPHRRSFKNPFKRDDRQSPRKLSSTKQHSLLYRLFHSTEDEDETVHESHVTLKCALSESESDSSGPCTPYSSGCKPDPANLVDNHFSQLPPPLLLSTQPLTPSKQPLQLTIQAKQVAQNKSSSSLSNFFKKEINKQPQGFMFQHLKSSERIELELASIHARASVSLLSTSSHAGVSRASVSSAQSPSGYVCVSIPPYQPAKHPTTSQAFDATKRNTSELSLSDKYGWVEKKCIGKGANGVVKVSHKQSQNCEKLYAIKEFRKKHKDESDKSFIKKLTSEFCIGSSLHHENVVETIDLIKNDQEQWCEVMEYCSGGDLCQLIQNKHLSITEVNTFFMQLIHGVAYIHKMGVSHRDLKPENLVLDGNGTLKLSDFGESEIFRGPYEQKTHKSKRCCGSEPYMAPEEFTMKEFDSVPIDIFACGVIYLAMTYNRLPWRKPTLDDSNFKFYSTHLQSGFAFIDRLMPGPRQLMRRILHPDPDLRASMDDILGDEWFLGIEREWEARGCAKG